LLAVPTIASKRWAYRQYDHSVGTNTIAQPGTSAAVVRVKGTTRGLALSVDGNGRYCYLDPYRGAMLAVAEAARNVACARATAIGATNNLNFGNPERPEIMWQFGEAVRGIGDACRHLQIPVTGGNVSLYNETEGRAIFPTPVLGIVGLFDNAESVATRVFKQSGAVVVALGDNRGELGGSEYLVQMHGLVRGVPPALDLDRERAVQALVVHAIANGWIDSAHDCSEGGLAITVAECTFDSGGIGVRVDVELANAALGAHAVNATLFGESASRVVVTTTSERLAQLLSAAQAAQVPAAAIGTTGGDRITIAVNGRVEIDSPVGAAEETWSTAIERSMTKEAAHVR
jgi:phosphoribosylformylglycinamidine synthase